MRCICHLLPYPLLPSATFPSRTPLYSFVTLRRPPTSTLFPYTTLFRSDQTVISSTWRGAKSWTARTGRKKTSTAGRSEEHTSELQSRGHLVCRLLLEKKNKKTRKREIITNQHKKPHHHKLHRYKRNKIL